MTCRPDRWWLGVIPLALIWGGANLVLQDGVEADLAAKAAQALARGGEPESARSWARVEPRGRDLTLAGEAPSANAKRLALERLRAIGAARRVEDRATAPPGSTLAWTAAREGADIVLTGSAPPDPQRAAILNEARQVFPTGEIVDKAAAVDELPATFLSAASLALRHLSRLSSGDVTVADGKILVHGQAASLDAYDAIRDASRGLANGVAVDLSDLRPATVEPYAWSAARSGEAIVLAGYAPSEQGRDEVLAMARRSFPTRHVRDRMRVAGGLREPIDFAAVTRFSLRQLPRLRTGSVELTDGALGARGEAADKDALAAVAADFRDEIPPGVRPGEVSLQAAVPSPYAFTVRRRADSLRLTGYYPDGGTRDAVLKLIRRRFFSEQVADEGRLADGAPKTYLLGIGFALDQLSLLASGEASVHDTSIRIVGETLYDQVAESAGPKATGAAPPGWTVAVDVRGRGAEGLVDPRTCQDLATRVLARAPIRFETGSAAIVPESEPLLGELAGVAKRCFPARIEIAAHTASAGSPDANLDLSRLWAQAVADSLVRSGVAADRLDPVGYGEMPLGAESSSGAESSPGGKSSPGAPARAEDGEARREGVTVRVQP